MNIKKVFIISIIIGLLIPFITRAQIKITEIMYDPEGTDTKREWIEVLNTGSSNVDLNTYFFFENNVFHKLVAQGNSILAPGAYAIIADSIAEVVAEYTDFMGQIFDSAFSLNNTGETISMANSAKEIIDSVTYTSEMGANNDGNSLQINEGDIISAGPTFGGQNKTVAEPFVEDGDTSGGSNSGTSSSNSSSNTSSHTQQEGISNYTAAAPFKIGIGRKRTVSIHTPIEFAAQVSKADIKPRFVWNLGDFTSKKGRKITHTYEYEGVHEVVLEAKADEYTSISRTEVRVVIPELAFSIASSTFTIQNNSKSEVNIGGFKINFIGGDSYLVPQNTIIAGGAEIRKKLDEGIVVQSFVYPNSEIYQRFDTI